MLEKITTPVFILKGFVGLKTCLPLRQTDLAYGLSDRYAKSGIAAEDSDTDLDFRDLPIEVPRHERLAR